MKIIARLIAKWLTSLIYRLIGRPRVDVSKKAEKIDTLSEHAHLVDPWGVPTFIGWNPVLDGKLPPNDCIDCKYSAVVLRHRSTPYAYRYHCQRCLKVGPTGNTIRGAWSGWNAENPNIKPATPRTLGQPGSAGPVTVDADPVGSLSTAVDSLAVPVGKPTDDEAGLPCVDTVRVSAAGSTGGASLPPEATDPKATDPWLKELSPDWDTHVNK